MDTVFDKIEVEVDEKGKNMKKQQRLSIIEFAKKFSTDKKFREYLFQKKWKNGFV